MKILFISNTRLGDAILTTGVLNHLLAKHKDARVTVVTSKVAAPIFEAIPSVTKIISIEKRKFGLHWFKLWQEARKTKWDIIVDFKHSLLSYFLCGKEKYFRTKKGYKHISEKNSSILNLAVPPFPRIWLDKIHYDNADRILLEQNLAYIVIAPTANWPCKVWPIENFIKLTKLIRKIAKFKNAKFLITAAPNEYELCKPLLKHLGESAIELIKGVDLLTVAACMKRAQVFIGNDSGLMHLAAAVGIPTIGIFGPTRDDLYSPFGQNETLAIRTKESYGALISKLKENNGLSKSSLMSSLTAEEVYTQLHIFYRKLGV